LRCQLQLLKFYGGQFEKYEEDNANFLKAIRIRNLKFLKFYLNKILHKFP